MLDEFIKQAKRLFSSKSNGANLIYSTTDKLHKYKLILLAVSIGLLLGYSQFRPHFNCQNSDTKIDVKALDAFCWINGTTTLDLVDPNDPQKSSQEENNSVSVLINYI